MTQNSPLKFSFSVQQGFSKFPDHVPLSSWDLVKSILTLHPEYGNGLAGKLINVGGPKGISRPLTEWQDGLVATLKYQGEVHGRLVILGLSRLDKSLGDFLSNTGFISALEKEIQEPLPDLFQVRKASSRQIFKPLTEASDANKVSEDEVKYSSPPPVEEKTTEPTLTKSTTEEKKKRTKTDPVKESDPFHIAPFMTRTNFWWLQANPEYWRIDRRKVGHRETYSTHSEKGAPRRMFQNFFNAHVDDIMIIYETSPSRRMRVLAKVTREATNREGDELEFEILYFFKNKTTWEELKALPLFSRTELVDNNQGSLFRISKEVFREVLNTTELAHQFGEDKVIANKLQRAFIDNDGAFAPVDHLNFTKDIKAFATLMAMKETKPPFAIALFGQWGTGKSFFMHHLRKNIDLLSEKQGFPVEDATAETLTNEQKLFCEGIVQIEFNAWSYLDANLWAGLVSMIFEKLDDYIDENTETQKEKDKIEKVLTEKLQIITEQKREILKEKAELTSERLGIEHQLKNAENDKKQLLSEIRKKSLRDMQREAKGKTKHLTDSVKKELASFGITEERITRLSPNALYDEVNSWVTFGRHILKFNMKDRILFVVAFALFGYIIVDPQNLIKDNLSLIGKGLMMTISAVGPFVKKLLNTFDQYKNLYGPVLEFKNNFNEQVRIAESDHQNRLHQLQAELGEKESKITNLAVDLDKKDKEIADVEYALTHSITKQAFFNFIRKKNDEGEYKKHLGLVSTIRGDFETLSNLFKGSNENDQKIDADIEFLKNFKKPLDRIILYIDDLDRCADDKVIEVLQAVHLLMAYPLFIVVVGVDKRCVHNALTHRNLLQYSQFVKNGFDDIEEVGINVIKPAEYLEKIFQIPFHVEQASDDNIKSMVTSLLKDQLAPEVETQEEKTRKAKEQIEATLASRLSAPSIEIFNNDINFRQSTAADAQANMEMIITKSVDPEPTKAKVRYVPPSDLKLTKTESLCLEDIACLVGNTPRTIKRYINMYRIIRAHELLSYTEELKHRTFTTIMFILAINVGRYSRYSNLIFSNCAKNPRKLLRDILGNDIEQNEIRKKLDKSPHLKLLFDIPGQDFVDHIGFVKRFSFNTAEQKDPVLLYEKGRKVWKEETDVRSKK